MSENTVVELPSDQFDAMLTELEGKLTKILHRTGEKVLEVMLLYAKKLACCSEFQLKIVHKRVGDLGVGAHMSEYVNKAAMVGRKEMPPVVARMVGISCATFVKLVDEDRAKLAANKPMPLKTRVGTIMKRPSDMTEDEHHRLVRHFPKPKVMPPEQQYEPRPKPKPSYYKLTDWELDGATVVCTFKLGASLFKGRITLSQLREMLASASRSTRIS